MCNNNDSCFFGVYHRLNIFFQNTGANLILLYNTDTIYTPDHKPFKKDYKKKFDSLSSIIAYILWSFHQSNEDAGARTVQRMRLLCY